MANIEQQPRGPEAHIKLIEQDAAERARELQKTQAEKGGEHAKESVERTIENARAEAAKESVSGREISRGEHKQAAHETPPIATKTAREASYKKTMKRVQQELPAPARLFSKVIHNPAIERASDAIGNTVARPNAILSGSITAIILVSSVYLLARHVGFALQGPETILAFLVGWALGILFDVLRVAIKGKN